MRLVTIFTFLRTSANVSRMLRSETVETQLLFLHKYPMLLHGFTFKALAFPQLMISRAIWENKGWLRRKGCGHRLHRENLGNLRSSLLFQFLIWFRVGQNLTKNELVHIADSFTNFTSWLNFAKCSSASRSTRSRNFCCRGTGSRSKKLFKDR